MREVFGIVVEELDGHMERLEAVCATKLAQMNRELERPGLDRIDPEADARVGAEGA